MDYSGVCYFNKTVGCYPSCTRSSLFFTFRLYAGRSYDSPNSVFSVWRYWHLVVKEFFLSGCLIYPVGITCVDPDIVQWAVGSNEAKITQETIEWWAKAPNTNIPLDSSNQPWFEHWQQISNRGLQLSRILQAMMGLPIVISLYFLMLFVNQRKKSRQYRTNTYDAIDGCVWVFLAALFGLAFGFLTVPDPRFWWGSLITLLILLPTMMFTYLFIKHRVSISSSSTFTVVLCLSIVVWGYVLLLDTGQDTFLGQVKSQNMIIPTIESKEIRSNGVIVRVPIADDKCWLAPKPCSPIEHSELRLDYLGRYLIFSKIKN